jgi:hypothetical protein
MISVRGKNSGHLLIILFLLVAAFQVSPKIFAQSQTDTIFFNKNLFSNNTPLEISIKSDFKRLKRKKMEGNYQQAEITYKIEDAIITQKVKIKPRGKNRRANCIFPPIAIKQIKPDSNKIQPMFYKTKLVLHCKQSKTFEKYVLKEYLCYKLYATLSNYSFKVRLINLTLIDTGFKSPKKSQSYAFVIEPHQLLVERLDAKVEKNEQLTQKSIFQMQIMELAMFQFMIGNFDWAIPTQQNIKLVRPKKSPQKIYAIPYDFDYCGLVNASYAVPNEEIGIGSVRERIYLGECKTEKELESVIEKFINLQKQFKAIVNEFKYLNINDKKLIIKYIDGFYKIIESGKFYKKYHLKRCKKIGRK